MESEEKEESLESGGESVGGKQGEELWSCSVSYCHQARASRGKREQNRVEGSREQLLISAAEQLH